MRVVVLGSGVIGTSIAYYAARAGHEVTVVDRQPGPALETSFANAGEVSPGYSAPWAGPGVPVKAIKWMLMTHSPLVIWPLLDPAMWRFGLRMLANCTERAYRLNKSRMVPIAEYSRDCLKALRAETGIAYDERDRGTLQLFRTQKQLDGVGQDIEILKQYGVAFEVLDRAGFCRAEPALSFTQQKFVGALRLPGDETGDCFLFSNRLAELARALGVQFRFDTRIDGISVAAGKVDAIRLAGEIGEGRCLRLRARQLFAAAAFADRHRCAGLSGQGLLDHAADRRCRPCAGVDHHGRDAQGGGHAARRPHSCRRHRRIGRLQPGAARSAARDARTRGQRSVPAWRRSRARDLLVRAASDDPRRHADRRADAATRTCGSRPATARSAGRWPRAPAA